MRHVPVLPGQAKESTFLTPYNQKETKWLEVNARLCLMKNPLLYRSTRPESGREVRERLGSLEFRASGAIGLRWQAVFGCSHRFLSRLTSDTCHIRHDLIRQKFTYNS